MVPPLNHVEGSIAIRIRRNDVGDFNTNGQEKCWHCSGYFPEAWIYDHADKCDSNPNKKVEQEEAE